MRPSRTWQRTLLAAALAAGAALAATTPAAAHDLWLIPHSFRPPAGATVALEVRIGERFPDSMNAPKPEGLTRLALVTAAGEIPIAGARTVDKVLAAETAAPGAGTAAVVLEGSPRHIDLTAEEFEDYLLHEGLAHIHDERVARGEDGAPGREDYSRHAKLLIRSAPGDGVATRPAGLQLELVPQIDPYDLSPGQPIPLVALFDGKPLGGLELRAYTVGGDVHRTTTGDDGTATLTLDRPGPWCVAFIHMRRCPDCPEADWRSYFGTLTFELPGAGGPPP